jgi:hypothetical protein
MCDPPDLSIVMAGLVPAIPMRRARRSPIEIAGTSPAMTLRAEVN